MLESAVGETNLQKTCNKIFDNVFLIDQYQIGNK